MRNQNLQLFLLLENDGVAQTLASVFPVMPAIHISARVPEQDSNANGRDSPVLKGTESCLLRRDNDKCAKGTVSGLWRPGCCLYYLHQFMLCPLWCRATGLCDRIVLVSIYRAKVATQSSVARNQIRNANRKSGEHEKRAEHSG